VHRACLLGHHTHGLCERSTYPQRLYEDDWTAANAVTLLERAPSDKPWFLWVSFPGPHPPFAVTADMAGEVAGRQWPSPVDSSNRTTLCDNSAGRTPSSTRSRCNYAAEMENLDRLFGTVLNAAAARGNTVERDTIVCFFSDHGEMLDDHDDTDKSKPWQGALAVPLVCSGPGITPNATIDVPMASVDIGATILDYAGATPHPSMSASSFRGLLEGAPPSTRNRTIVLSGLQSHDFDTPPAAAADADPDTEQGVTFNFRLAVAQLEGKPYKYVCCKGHCPGQPSNVPPPDDDGYTRLLFDTADDPFDMADLKRKRPHVAETLRAALPVEHGFNCSRAPHAAHVES